MVPAEQREPLEHKLQFVPTAALFHGTSVLGSITNIYRNFFTVVGKERPLKLQFSAAASLHASPTVRVVVQLYNDMLGHPSILHSNEAW